MTFTRVHLIVFVCTYILDHLIPLKVPVLCAQYQGHDETIQTKSLSKDQNEDETNIQLWLPPDSANAVVADNADS